MPQVVAVVGLPGAGKSEVVSLLSERMGYFALYFGGVVLAEVEARGLPPGPESERSVREDLRRQFGMAAMAIRSFPKVLAMINAGHRVVIDGLYSMAEREYLDKKLGKNVLLIAVSAHRWIRYERLARRTPRPLSPAQVDARDLAEVQKLDKARPIVLADYQITNNGTHEDLARDAVGLLKKFGERSAENA